MGLDELIGPGAWDSYDSPASPSRSDIEQAETIYQEQVSDSDYKSDIVDEQVASPGDKNAFAASLSVTDVKE